MGGSSSAGHGNTGCRLDTRPKASRNGAIVGVDIRESKESVRGREAASARESVCGLKSAAGGAQAEL